MSVCRHHVVYDGRGAWSCIWDCGDRIIGISDYDLRRSIRHHVCVELTQGETPAKVLP